MILVVQDFFRGVIRWLDQFELDERRPVVDAGEAQDVKRGEGLWKERVRDGEEIRHLGRIHLGVKRHEKIEVRLVEEVQVFQSRRGSLEMLDEVVEWGF